MRQCALQGRPAAGGRAVAVLKWRAAARLEAAEVGLGGDVARVMVAEAEVATRVEA